MLKLLMLKLLLLKLLMLKLLMLKLLMLKLLMLLLMLMVMLLRCLKREMDFGKVLEPRRLMVDFLCFVGCLAVPSIAHKSWFLPLKLFKLEKFCPIAAGRSTYSSQIPSGFVFIDIFS